MKLSQNVCLDQISDDLKMGHVGSKTRSLSQIFVKPYVRSRGHIFSPILINMFVLMKSHTDLKIGHVRSKSRSLVQILEKPCARSRGHIDHETWSECFSR